MISLLCQFWGNGVNIRVRVRARPSSILYLQQRFHLLQQLMIRICFREEPLSTQNYRDDPTRVHVPETQAATSENRLTSYPRLWGRRYLIKQRYVIS